MRTWLNIRLRVQQRRTTAHSQTRSIPNAASSCLTLREFATRSLTRRRHGGIRIKYLRDPRPQTFPIDISD